VAAEGGAAWLTIHARTRVAGYAPPVHWALIGRVRERLGIPVVANGDVWSVEGFRRCREETGCRHFMLGRGALANPRLPRQVAIELGIVPGKHSNETDRAFDWVTQLQRLVECTQVFAERRPEQTIRRLKQWLNLAATFGNFTGFDTIKRARSIDELFAILRNSA
jgi:tRNA-dihydrouridine synthase C